MSINIIDITNSVVAKAVLDVQIPAYQVEAEIIQFYDLPPLKDTVESLTQCGETFIGFYIDGELCGVISYKIENTVIDIHRLVVHPRHFRKGIAKGLLEFVESSFNASYSLTVSTGAKNSPAITFYNKNGFTKTKEIPITEGLTIACFRKYIKTEGGSN
ncbi:GNAT family N-acetyltransferase [Bacillus luteolus]|uniref:GNAT family N-acetyltransferase n=1 Tax=Litchfieldia luteola TaxID=682179 RepID=A0ABR9QGE7_9BACI|nr:GNAT family N-acetyltransferase [Cytobacillus luteolus]MBE4907501.1 GNAT family N-acetyltransferase [Cytobacillus luteolus]MBP1944269.1 ribosomal protein S18 acetylase RimI-like enzyme [Cytobacillus luteolus]